MEIKILGPGCPKCLKLEAMTKETLAMLGRSDEVAHIADLDEIMQYAVMFTPALVVDGVVRVQGHLPRRQDLEAWLRTG